MAMTDSETVTVGPDSTMTDPAGPGVDEPADVHVAEGSEDASRPRRRLSISISARSLAVALIIAVLVAAVAAFAWLYIDARGALDAKTHGSENNAHAEKIALDYAVNAAAMDFKDLNAWKVKLVADTSQELNDKLTKAATSMEQILVPLQWVSSAQPITATVRSSTGGTYVVNCFVSVETKTVQAPDPLQSTATYSLTIDSNKDWQITDVGGIGAVVGQK
jgi:Mce-associated membrane protein